MKEGYNKKPPAYGDEWTKVYATDALSGAAMLEPQSVHTIVTSPPYWSLRSYLPSDDPNKSRELGAEKSPEEYVENLVEIFHALKTALRADGTLWLNLGDSYNAHPGQRKITDKAGPKQQSNAGSPGAPSRHVSSLKPKDLIGLPWMVAFALRADGWYLRSDIVWSKPNPMPESVTDRPTKSHEYLFLLTKSPRYFFDQEAVREKCISSSPAGNKYSLANGRVDGRESGGGWELAPEKSIPASGRNLRSVWNISTQPFSGRELLRGKAGTESEDCAIHGDSDVARSIRAAVRRDVLQEVRTPRSADTDARRAQEPEGADASTISRRSASDCPEGTARAHTPESTDESRTRDERNSAGVPSAPVETRSRTNRTPAQRESSASTNNSEAHAGSSTASDRSTQAHKMASQSLPDEASVDEASHTQYKEQLFAFSEPHPGKPASKTSRGASGVRLRGRIEDRIADKLSCTCIIPDHYATFPPALVYPCIKAGTSERGVCEACGSPWKRVVQKPDHREAPQRNTNKIEDKSAYGRNGYVNFAGSKWQEWKDANPSRTVGWQLTCSCQKNGAGAIPATVLDPFCGSGTTMLAARKLGRRSIGFDLDARNIELVRSRLGDQGVLL